MIEGLVSVLFAIDDETLSLFGFGVDSFVEVISGIGIWHMIKRINSSSSDLSDPFERRALIITGSAFYLLTAGLLLSAGTNLYQGHHPETTFWGIVISLISIFTMWALIHFKMKVGKHFTQMPSSRMPTAPRPACTCHLFCCLPVSVMSLPDLGA